MRDDRGWRGVVDTPPRTLFDALTEHDLLDDETIEAKFQFFHQEHPEVYAKLRELALDLVRRGHRKHLGMKMLWETLRYFTILGAPTDSEPFRLNNNYTARYARLLMDQEPELADVFETRVLRSA